MSARFSDIQFLFFDYGGVLDSHGIHTRVLFWDAVSKAQILPAKEEIRREFQEAYTWVDQDLMRSGSALGMGLKDFNYHNLALILKAMELAAHDENKLEIAATMVTELQKKCLTKSAEVLAHLKLPKGIISNFTGNLTDILKEQNLARHFEHVTESYYVGAAKPDPSIFLTALSRVKFAPEECLFIGDNVKNDIEPARELGIKTVLFDPNNKNQNAADHTIAALEELLTLF